MKAEDLMDGRAALGFTLLALVFRLLVAGRTFLNPEEAFHALLATSANIGFLLKNPIIGSHPPLLLFSDRIVQIFSHTAFALRLPLVVAGTFFPLLIWHWLRRVHSREAAWICFLILLCSPNFVFLGTQNRGYAAALFLIALSLYCLEQALSGESARWMAAFSAALCLALLTEYMALWYCGAVGVYAMVRLFRTGHSRRLRQVWGAGQLGAAAVCFWLQQLRGGIRFPALTPAKGFLATYLADSYLRANQNWAGFIFHQTAGVFSYLFSTSFAPVGVMALFVFLAGLWILLIGRPAPGRGPDPSLALLLVAPFVLTAAAGSLRLFPYGGTRHNSHLLIFAAAGIAIALAPLLRRHLATIAVVLFTLSPFWFQFLGPSDSSSAPLAHLSLARLHEAIDFLHDHVPPGSLILTDRESRLILSYYLDPNQPWPRKVHDGEEQVGGYLLYSRRWIWTESSQIREDLGHLLRRHGLGPRYPIWAVDTGFYCGVRYFWRREPDLRRQFPLAREFGFAVAVFRTPPGFASGFENGPSAGVEP